MKELIKNLKGDKGIWSFVVLLALISFMPVFSASTNLVYVIGKGSTIGYLVKHLVHIFIGFALIYFVHKVPYHYYRALSQIAMPIVGLLLVFTFFQGTVIGGANASRWIKVPFIGVTFQTSALAMIVLMVYVARYLAKIEDKKVTFKSSFIELWIPVFIILALILPANFSTAALIFSMVCMLVFVGKYPMRYLAMIIGIGVTGLTLFVLFAMAFPKAMPNRVDTWMSRIERFTTDEPNEDDYQIEKAKIAIATGQIYGLGPGKSVQKNFLPQSSSDFIFAIIVEEYGLVGGLGVLFLYLILFFRFLVSAHKAKSLFGKLLIVGLGFPIIFQALINMGVAVELLPVTGQTLPLISSGGSSVWMTCIAIGIIISVTKKEEEVAQELAEKEEREAALKQIIDEHILRERQQEEAEAAGIAEPSYSIEDKAKNPMHAVMGK
ncbi:FtsW/RodA/SpoVE family cell cycle protein [Flavobacterium salilacus subsp. salilacus]|uniref:FtsW/RodA/SpoVE family cell cycle protein n=1 Tax=Flavobacterium TaxID=237 RepID=UPI00107563F4|nr:MULTISPECIES: FtsW/RodA/SpoVE family cell cycle protein [Flavobacterium]KAF2518099.1 FtsW/RodA/SpoVE family cell cycle protein [Flavobacterium salilacus subsp. salilacus]MBE1615592.1 FtsW/RodA/SpoVE family cell cycle protein [Flavobacterium sp. SaA2.13]